MSRELAAWLLLFRWVPRQSDPTPFLPIVPRIYVRGQSIFGNALVFDQKLCHVVLLHEHFLRQAPRKANSDSHTLSLRSPEFTAKSNDIGSFRWPLEICHDRHDPEQAHASSWLESQKTIAFLLDFLLCLTCDVLNRDLPSKNSLQRPRPTTLIQSPLPLPDILQHSLKLNMDSKWRLGKI